MQTFENGGKGIHNGPFLQDGADTFNDHQHLNSLKDFNILNLKKV